MKILCINLDSRPDRWQQATEEFNRVGLQVERVAACSSDNRPLAFNQSVYKAMQQADGDNLLLFEDDVIFDTDALDLPRLAYFPVNAWNALTVHLGCNIFGTDTMNWQMPTFHNKDYAKLHNCWQSHATLYSAECVDFILKNLNPNILDGDNNIFDDWLRRKVLSMGRSYLLRPMIAYQRPSFSDIWQTESNYTGAHTRGNEYLKILSCI